jgi:hypothetical protein
VIPVQRRPPPADFDALVRIPGLRRLHEKVGLPPPPGLARTSGAPCRQLVREGVALTSLAELRGADLSDHWVEAIDMLIAAYGPTCMYSCFRVRLGVDVPTVDHMAPKSVAPARAYDWDNMRLALPRFNANKGAAVDVVDPFDVLEGMFALELVSGQIRPGARAGAALVVAAAVAALKLNAPDTCARRAELVADHQVGGVSLDHIRKENPFVAAEIERQGLPAQARAAPLRL